MTLDDWLARTGEAVARQEGELARPRPAAPSPALRARVPAAAEVLR